MTGVLVVDEFRAGDLHDSRQMLFAKDSAGVVLQQRHYDFWVDRPTKLVADFAQRYLESRGVADRVFREAGDINGDWLLGGELRRFELLSGQGQSVVVGIAFKLSDLRQRDVLPRSGEVTVEESLNDNPSPADVVAAYQRALSKALDQFVQTLTP